jgi:hypothetical protein
VTNAAGSATSSNAVLTVLAPPTITTQPQNQAVNQGNTATFTVSATGTAPLSYQWQWYGTNLAGATSSNLVLNNVTTNQSGPYTVVVTNAYGTATSQVALLTVSAVFQAGGLSPIWKLAPGSRSYLTINSLPNERGVAYNPANGHLLVINRTTPSVYVLDAATGADVNQLSVSGISGGTYSLLLVGVADDGVVYAGNLTTASSTTSFTLYRWANDSAGTVPTVAYTGNPTSGNSQRYGDTLDVRGAGANTQIILGSRSSTNAVMLTTTDGTSFTAKNIIVADAATSSFGLGLAFGTSNTFWGKSTSVALRQVSYNLTAGTGYTAHVYADPAFPNTVGPIGVSTQLNVLAGINVGASNNHLRLYDLTPTLTNGAPALVATNAFATDNDNSGTGTGAVDFGGTIVYALCANNGLMALQITPAVVNIPPGIIAQPQDRNVNAGQSATFSVTASGTAPLSYQWRCHGTNIGGATASGYTRSNVQPGDAGSYSVVVTNVAGSLTSSNAALTVNVPPTITTQPLSQTNLAGSSVTVSVTATGTEPLSYWWQYNGSTHPPGGSSFVVTEAGSYSVIVSNLAGWVVSDTATLTLTNPPPAQPGHFDSTGLLPDGSVQLFMSGTPATNYVLEFTGDWLGWSNLTTLSGANGLFQFNDPAATNKDQRFYRLRVGP